MKKLLDSVLGFRPSEADMQLMIQAEAVTGRKRSDILRACFYHAIGAVVEELDFERRQTRSEFDKTLSEVLVLNDKVTAAHGNPPKHKPNLSSYKLSRKSPS